jgi:hypothetical protein
MCLHKSKQRYQKDVYQVATAGNLQAGWQPGRTRLLGDNNQEMSA